MRGENRGRSNGDDDAHYAHDNNPRSPNPRSHQGQYQDGFDDVKSRAQQPNRDARQNHGQAQSTMSYKLGFADIVSRLMREIWLIILVFIILLALGLMLAFSMPKSYTANASLLMQLGQDYVYIPRAGDAGRGAIATIDAVVQSEVEIMGSTELKKRVVKKLGYDVIMPNTPDLWSPKTPADVEKSENAASKTISQGLTIATTPNLGVVHLDFKHAKSVNAALILNTLINEYKTYRIEVFSDRMGPLLIVEKKNFDNQLYHADSAYNDFLQRNGVVDFVTTKQSYGKIYDLALAEQYSIDETLAQYRAKLNILNGRMHQIAPEMSIQRDLDLTIPTKILNLRQQRQELLARYLPNAQPIIDIDAQISALQAMMNSGSAIGEKEHRLGANPIYADMVTQKLNMESEIAALSGRKAKLNAQAQEVAGKLQNLSRLESEFTNLSSVRDALQSNIKTFTQRIQENAAAQAIAKGGDETVRVVGLAHPPQKGSSLRMPVALGAFLVALLSAICVGLLRSFTRKGFGSAKMAQNALDLPILAQARQKT